jgi:Ca-activated chloride channel family protein
MARAGQGEPFVVLKPGEAAKQAARFRRYIESPVLTNIRVSFQGFDAAEVEPPSLPDLFAQRPLILLGKYRGSPAGAIVVTGKTAKGNFEQKIKVAPDQASPDNAALRVLWARHRLIRLADQGLLERDKNADRIKEITALGLKYSLMTAYTSFVAVDQVKRSDGKVVTVKQPLPLPAGVSDLAVGGSGGGLRSKAMMMPSPMASRGDMAGRTSPERYVTARPSVLPTPPTGTPAPEVKISIQVVQVKGRLDKKAIKEALEAELPRLRACCLEALKTGIKLPASVTLTFDIGAGGKVSGPVLPKLPLGYEDLTKCLSQAVQNITFPDPGKKVVKATVKLVLAAK